MLSPNQRESKVLETRSLAFLFTTLSLALSSYIPLMSQNQHVPNQLLISSLDLTYSLNKYLLSANCKPGTGLRVGTDKRQMRHCLVYGNVHVYWRDE